MLVGLHAACKCDYDPDIVSYLDFDAVVKDSVKKRLNAGVS